MASAPGDVHVGLSDRARAEAAYREALAIAHAQGDAYGLAEAAERLSDLLADGAGREPEVSAAAREAERAGRASRSHLAVEVGRNEPCPCGSGRKYKRCCGA